LRRAADQLAEYFAGQRRDFDLPLAPEGTEFQQRVWHRMTKIPYGKTMTYGDLARAIGSAPRAVGGACGRNPIAIILPCHRVIGGSGALTGYSGAGGINTKQFLLELEGALTPAFRVSA
jgi:methylated-DNA-[protein]-cysteine S-methyltransferase